MTQLLQSARLKLDRASEHIEAVEEAVDCWRGTKAGSVSREIDPKTGHTVRRAQIKESPAFERISLLAGDAVQNLRAALDHAVYALAQRQLGTIPLDVEGMLMYPIVGNENSKGEPVDGAVIFDQEAHRRLRGVPDGARTFIQEEQPYHWDDGYVFHLLWVIHDLSRIDKHRRLAVAAAFLDFQFLTVPKGVEPRVTFARGEGPINDGDVLVVYSGADIGVQAHFSLGVTLNEGTMATRAVDEHLPGLHQQVQWVVHALEGFL